MSFAVAALPHSGTTWLARLLATSPTFDVRHEYPGDIERYEQESFRDVASERFIGRPRYGEVSALLRFVLDDLPVEHRAVLIRDPRDVVLSSVNRDPKRHALGWFRQHIEDLNRGLRRLVQSADQGSTLFRLEDVTTDRDQLENLITALGVDDVDATTADLNPLNVCGARRWESVEDLGEKHVKALDAFEWFTDLHYGFNFR